MCVHVFEEIKLSFDFSGNHGKREKRLEKREEKENTHTHTQTTYTHARERMKEYKQLDRGCLIEFLSLVLEGKEGKKEKVQACFRGCHFMNACELWKGGKNQRALSIFICFQFFVCFSYLCPGFVGRDSQVRMLLFLPCWQYLESSTMKRMNMMKRGKRKK